MGADFRLGDWIVRPQRRVIERGEVSVHIKPKPMAVLGCLAAARGATVSRNELFDAVWPGGEVSDHTLNKCIVELRKAFGDTARDSRVIETIPKLGFRLVPPVGPVNEDSEEAIPAVPENQAPRIKAKRWLQLAGLLLIALGVLLSLDGPRSWLSNGSKARSLGEGGDPGQQLSEHLPGIAVLPFTDLSSDPGNEYFSRGLSEEILNTLAAVSRVPVIARTSSFQFSSAGADIRKIGRQLNVSHVLEGSVRRSEGSVRVSAQLFDTTSGVYVWADVFQRELTDIIQLQVDIAQQVVDQIGAAIGGDAVVPSSELSELELVTARRTNSIEAYDFYLKGTQLLASGDPIPVEQAEAYFDRAIALDEGYADAWAGKGRALHRRGLTAGGHPDMPADVFPRAIAAYRRALEIEPRHAVAMGWLGVALMQNDFEWSGGLRLMEQSLEINPNNAAMLSRYGARLERLNLEGSAEVMDRAFRLDPFGLVPTVYRSSQLQQQGRMLDAADVAEAALVGNRDSYSLNFTAALLNCGAAAMMVDDEGTRSARLESAEAQIRRARRVAHPVDLGLDVMEMVVSAVRNNTRFPWREILDRARRERLNGLMIWAFYGQFEDEELMVEALDLAIEQRDPELWLLFGSKPTQLPEADWRRMRDIAGVTRFQSAR